MGHSRFADSSRPLAVALLTHLVRPEHAEEEVQGDATGCIMVVLSGVADSSRPLALALLMGHVPC